MIENEKCQFCSKKATNYIFAVFVCDSEDCINKARGLRGGPGGHKKLKDEKETMKKISTAALMGICLLTLLVIVLLFYLIFAYIRPFSWTVFWAGIISLIVALIFYLAHAITENKYITRSISSTFGILGISFLYLSIVSSKKLTQEGKIIRFIVLSIIVIVILLFIWGMSRESFIQRKREENRKKT